MFSEAVAWPDPMTITSKKVALHHGKLMRMSFYSFKCVANILAALSFDLKFTSRGAAAPG